MKKFIKTLSAVLIVALTASFSVPVFAYSVPETVRVGLEFAYKDVKTVPIGNDEIEIGCEYKEEFYSETELSSRRGFSVTIPSGVAVDANEYFDDYENALEECDDIEDMWGYEAVPAYVDRNQWGVYICELSNSEAREAASDLDGSVISSSRLMVLLDGSDVVMAFDKIEPQFAPISGNIEIGARSYRGVIEIGRYTGNNITAVNVIELDEYLYGVVPSEMPSLWHIEALKAQSVAARSYALTRMGVHSDSGYDLCDGTNCQVYIGVTQEKEQTTKAVNATHGEVALYNGAPINAVFSSSSGGSTDNSENVWANVVPYLKAVPEINETGASEWSRMYSASELNTILADKGINVGKVMNMEITEVGAYGRVQEITITGTSGTKVLTKEETRTLFSGTSQGSLASRMFTINGEGSIGVDYSPSASSSGNGTSSVYISSRNDSAILKILNAHVLNGEGEKLDGLELSSIYAVSKGNDVSKLSSGKSSSNSKSSSSSGETTRFEPSGDTVDTFEIVGKGLGHGVGMSQYGAKGMAEEGYTYEEILKHYYTGITIE